MTFQEFCHQWDVTLNERKLLVVYLAALRIKSTLRLAFDNTEQEGGK